jgi:hypothetical protein
MDNIQKKNLKESIEHTSLFFSIIQDYYNKMEANELSENELDKMVEFMKNNHLSNKRSLENIGLSFDDTGKIRKLNEKIRSLEKKLGQNDLLTPENVSSYISNIEDNYNKRIRNEYGINVSFSISISSCISVNIKYIKACLPLKDRKLNCYKNEEEYNKEKIKHDFCNNVASNSILEFSNEGDIYFTENNISYFENAINSLFSELGRVNDINHNVSFFKSKLKKGDKEMYIVRNSEFTVTTLSSHLALQDLFNR